MSAIIKFIHMLPAAVDLVRHALGRVNRLYTNLVCHCVRALVRSGLFANKEWARCAVDVYLLLSVYAVAFCATMATDAYSLDMALFNALSPSLVWFICAEILHPGMSRDYIQCLLFRLALAAVHCPFLLAVIDSHRFRRPQWPHPDRVCEIVIGAALVTASIILDFFLRREALATAAPDDAPSSPAPLSARRTKRASVVRD